MVKIYIDTTRRKYGEKCLCCGMIGRDNQETGTNKPELILAEPKESMLCRCLSTVYLLTLCNQTLYRYAHLSKEFDKEEMNLLNGLTSGNCNQTVTLKKADL